MEERKRYGRKGAERRLQSTSPEEEIKKKAHFYE
jgi:hypothetical protein